MRSQFEFTTLGALIGASIVIIISLIIHSYLFFISGCVIIFCTHQILYIHGMFSASSNFFFKTMKGKEYFHNPGGVLFRFDDGPHPVYTPQILDILKAEGMRALFAVTGENAVKYPEIVARMYREGHIVANHTYSHPLNILFLGYNRIKDELIRTNTIIQSITGASPKYFCPPMGHKNPVIARAVIDLGLIPVMWDIRTMDTTKSFEKIMARIKKKFRPPAIIMFHDAIIPWSKSDRKSTVLALKETIRILKERHCL